MPFNSTGQWVRTHAWNSEAQRGLGADSIRFDEDANDMTAGFTQKIAWNRFLRPLDKNVESPKIGVIVVDLTTGKQITNFEVVRVDDHLKIKLENEIKAVAIRLGEGHDNTIPTNKGDRVLRGEWFIVQDRIVREATSAQIHQLLQDRRMSEQAKSETPVMLSRISRLNRIARLFKDKDRLAMALVTKDTERKEKREKELAALKLVDLILPMMVIYPTILKMGIMNPRGRAPRPVLAIFRMNTGLVATAWMNAIPVATVRMNAVPVKTVRVKAMPVTIVRKNAVPVATVRMNRVTGKIVGSPVVPLTFMNLPPQPSTIHLFASNRPTLFVYLFIYPTLHSLVIVTVTVFKVIIKLREKQIALYLVNLLNLRQKEFPGLSGVVDIVLISVFTFDIEYTTATYQYVMST